MGRIPAVHASRDPKRAALVIGDQIITREALEAGANRRGRLIAQHGVVQNDFVAVALPNGVEFYETLFALWKLGAVPNIVPYSLAPAEIGAIVQLVDPKLLIGAIDIPGRSHIPAGVAVDQTLSAEPLPDAVSPHWKAMVSGGSTGRPKVIVDRMPGLWNPDQAVFGQIPNDILLNPGPLYHNAPFIGMSWGLLSGATVLEMGRFDAETALRLIEQWKVGWVNLVPTMMQRIWKLDPAVRAGFDLSSLRTVFHMGAACPTWLKQAWIDWLGADRIVELYAGTERQGATLITGEEWLKHKGSVGRIQPGSRIRILNEAHEDVAVEEVGEIYFLPDNGRGATYHYIGSEANTYGEWESLGDLGYLDADGYLYLSDRRTDLIVSGGANVYPAEIESALESHPDVRASVVVGLSDPEWGQRIHAIVELEPGVSLSGDALLAHAATLLARFKLPKTVDFVEYPLRNEAGKTRRSALRDARNAAEEPTTTA
jgi:bile acid-coenzyme A ligase